MFEMNNEKHVMNRSSYFDNMKGILMFFVVFAHFFDLTAYPYQLDRTLYIFIYFFHMPALIFISGYFSKNAEKSREFAVRKYFIPYMLLAVLSYIHRIIIDGGITSPFRFFHASTGCWFLFCLFVYKLFLKDLIQIRGCLILALVCGCLSGFSSEFGKFFSLQRMAAFLFFYLLGYYTTKDMIQKIRKIPKMVSVAIILVTMVISYYLAADKDFSVVLLHCKKSYNDKATMFEFGIRILVYLVATAMILALCNLMIEKECILTKIGRNSLAVYFLHLFIMRRLDFIMETFDITIPSPYIYLGVILILSALCVFVCSRDVFTRLISKANDEIVNLFYRKSTQNS